MGSYRWFLACVIALFSATASAADFYWQVQGVDGQFPTAMDACRARFPEPVVGKYDTATLDGFSDDPGSSNPSYFQCNVKHTSNINLWEPYYTYVPLYRWGDGCPPGTTYDEQTGGCPVTSEPNGEACEIEGQSPLTGFGFIRDASGQCVDYTRADLPSQCRALANTSGFTDVRVDFDSDGNPQTPPPMDVGGCAGQVVTVEHCEMAPQRCQNGLCMQSSSNRCRVAVSFNGEVAGDSSPLLIKGQDGSEEGVCPPGENCDPEPAPVQKEEQPCNYVEDGEGRMVCSATKWTAEPGQQSCGSFNGKFDCYGRAPTSNGIQIDTKVETKPNATGGTTTTKTDTHTQTICTGANSCTTTTTVNVSKTDKNAAGETTGQSNSCTGPKCAGSGKTDSDGDGIADETEEEGEGLVGQDWYETGEDTYASVLQGFVDRVRASPMGQASANYLSVNSGGSCPRWSVSVWVFDIELDQFCSGDIPWSAIKAVILAAAGFLAFRMAFY